jgi:hypothetical protein
VTCGAAFAFELIALRKSVTAAPTPCSTATRLLRC